MTVSTKDIFCQLARSREFWVVTVLSVRPCPYFAYKALHDKDTLHIKHKIMWALLRIKHYELRIKIKA